MKNLILGLLLTLSIPLFSETKVALITGSAKGIGREIALKLADENYQVLCWL